MTAPREKRRDRPPTPRSYFDSMYATDADPWGFDSREYERRKYDLTVGLLPQRRYRRALEPGCSNGALTERLAARCDSIVAFDFIPGAIERARARLGHHEHVEVVVAHFPDHWPPGGGDLLVMSEVAYYLDHTGLQSALGDAAIWLEDGGTLLAVHYTGETDYPLSGRDVSAVLDDVAWLTRTSTLVDEGFEAGVWRKRPNES